MRTTRQDSRTRLYGLRRNDVFTFKLTGDRKNGLPRVAFFQGFDEGYIDVAYGNGVSGTYPISSVCNVRKYVFEC